MPILAAKPIKYSSLFVRINNKLDTSPNDILYTSKSGNRKEEAHKIEYTYIEQTYTTNITEEKETKNIKQA